jgi:hypothetical protein
LDFPASSAPYRKPQTKRSENKPEIKTKRQQASERKEWKETRRKTERGNTYGARTRIGKKTRKHNKDRRSLAQGGNKQ